MPTGSLGYYGYKSKPIFVLLAPVLSHDVIVLLSRSSVPPQSQLNIFSSTLREKVRCSGVTKVPKSFEWVVRKSLLKRWALRRVSDDLVNDCIHDEWTADYLDIMRYLQIQFYLAHISKSNTVPGTEIWFCEKARAKFVAMWVWV